MLCRNTSNKNRIAQRNNPWHPLLPAGNKSTYHQPKAGLLTRSVLEAFPGFTQWQRISKNITHMELELTAAGLSRNFTWFPFNQNPYRIWIRTSDFANVTIYFISTICYFIFNISPLKNQTISFTIFITFVLWEIEIILWLSENFLNLKEHM